MPPFGRVYHVGNGADMVKLLESEGGLAWTSHARIKGSSWTPDIFRSQPFYKSTSGWGPRGRRCRPTFRSTDWAREASTCSTTWPTGADKKYLPGEVDVFKIDHTHELYGHMNINYIRLEPDRVPRFDESWQPVLDSLRAGRFFVTTGEVLIPEFTVNGQPSGSSVVLKPSEPVEVRFRSELDVSAPIRRVRSRATARRSFATGSTSPTQARLKNAV